MSFSREPGAELNTGEPTVPRRAATVVLLRGGRERLEVLLVQRNPEARFMGGAWVFPGGSVGPEDGEGQVGLRAAAVRELEEEAGVVLSPGTELVAFARWITPAQLHIRFDTWFYLARAPEGASPRVDGAEVVDFCWITPADALAAGEAGQLDVVFPTVKQLEQLAGFASAEELIEYARGQEVRPVEPRVTGSGEMARIVLPGEPGYEG
ncbi:MAG TPA: NUDIX hydrolase [Solirubrobacteraceae bacterium]|jgi:8-oxo-dGTP pyrophosphatase MutT (NUDIX family)|nr:NUDIX hydrolase [Solirubrobacteraceae bacterium]